MPEAEAATYRIDPFDLTKVWNYRDYPLIPIARLVLNRTPDSFFGETEQAAFDPSHFVPGIGPSPDRCCRRVCSATATRIATASASTTRDSR
jgi:catalase